MIVLILNVSIPLFQSPHAEQVTGHPLTIDSDAAEALSISIDDYREVIYAIHAPNRIVFLDGASGDLLEEQSIAAPEGHPDARLTHARFSGNHEYTLIWDTGHVSSLFVKLRPSFDDEGVRRITFEVNNRGTFPPAESGTTLNCLLYTSPSPRDLSTSRMPSSA